MSHIVSSPSHTSSPIISSANYQPINSSSKLTTSHHASLQQQPQSITSSSSTTSSLFSNSTSFPLLTRVCRPVATTSLLSPLPSPSSTNVIKSTHHLHNNSSGVNSSSGVSNNDHNADKTNKHDTSNLTGIELYEQIKCIGKGSFGSIYLVRDRITLKLRILKIITLKTKSLYDKYMHDQQPHHHNNQDSHHNNNTNSNKDDTTSVQRHDVGSCMLLPSPSSPLSPSFGGELSREYATKPLNEITIHRYLSQHAFPYICRYITAFIIKDNNIGIIMEYYANGDLNSLIKHHRSLLQQHVVNEQKTKENQSNASASLTSSSLSSSSSASASTHVHTHDNSDTQLRKLYWSEQTILDCFVQICLAVKYMHDRHILHRDLKCSNIFLEERKPRHKSHSHSTSSSSSSTTTFTSASSSSSYPGFSSSYTLRVGDFGVSSRVSHRTAYLCSTRVGTPYFLSPELINNEKYSDKCDIWSLGCILYEMCTFHHAFRASNLSELIGVICRCSPAALPRHYSARMTFLVEWMLSKEPSARPTVNDILRLQFVRKRIPAMLSSRRIVEEFKCEFHEIPIIAWPPVANIVSQPSIAALNSKQLDDAQAKEVPREMYQPASNSVIPSLSSYTQPLRQRRHSDSAAAIAVIPPSLSVVQRWPLPYDSTNHLLQSSDFQRLTSQAAALLSQSPSSHARYLPSNYKEHTHLSTNSCKTTFFTPQLQSTPFSIPPLPKSSTTAATTLITSSSSTSSSSSSPSPLQCPAPQPHPHPHAHVQQLSSHDLNLPVQAHVAATSQLQAQGASLSVDNKVDNTVERSFHVTKEEPDEKDTQHFVFISPPAPAASCVDAHDPTTAHSSDVNSTVTHSSTLNNQRANDTLLQHYMDVHKKIDEALLLFATCKLDHDDAHSHSRSQPSPKPCTSNSNVNLNHHVDQGNDHGQLDNPHYSAFASLLQKITNSNQSQGTTPINK